MYAAMPNNTAAALIMMVLIAAPFLTAKAGGSGNDPDIDQVRRSQLRICTTVHIADRNILKCRKHFWPIT